MSDMADVLVQHQRQNASSCLCGWSELGKSHPAHQAAALTAAGFGPVREARAGAWAECEADRRNRQALFMLENEWGSGRIDVGALQRLLRGDEPDTCECEPERMSA